MRSSKCSIVELTAAILRTTTVSKTSVWNRSRTSLNTIYITDDHTTSESYLQAVMKDIRFRELLKYVSFWVRWNCSTSLLSAVIDYANWTRRWVLLSRMKEQCFRTRIGCIDHRDERMIFYLSKWCMHRCVDDRDDEMTHRSKSRSSSMFVAFCGSIVVEYSARRVRSVRNCKWADR